MSLQMLIHDVTKAHFFFQFENLWRRKRLHFQPEVLLFNGDCLYRLKSHPRSLDFRLHNTTISEESRTVYRGVSAKYTLHVELSLVDSQPCDLLAV